MKHQLCLKSIILPTGKFRQVKIYEKEKRKWYEEGEEQNNIEEKK